MGLFKATRSSLQQNRQMANSGMRSLFGRVGEKLWGKEGVPTPNDRGKKYQEPRRLACQMALDAGAELAAETKKACVPHPKP